MLHLEMHMPFSRADVQGVLSAFYQTIILLRQHNAPYLHTNPRHWKRVRKRCFPLVYRCTRLILPKRTHFDSKEHWNKVQHLRKFLLFNLKRKELARAFSGTLRLWFTIHFYYPTPMLYVTFQNDDAETTRLNALVDIWQAAGMHVQGETITIYNPCTEIDLSDIPF